VLFCSKKKESGGVVENHESLDIFIHVRVKYRKDQVANMRGTNVMQYNLTGSNVKYYKYQYRALETRNIGKGCKSCSMFLNPLKAAC
jgi:hypothetical protein